MPNKFVINGEFASSEQELFLTVQVSKPNWAKTKVWLEKDEKLFDEDIQKRSLGKGSDCKGKTLYLKTPVTDMDSTSNWMSVIYTLEDGKTKQSYSGTLTVDQNGDTGTFIGQIKVC